MPPTKRPQRRPDDPGFRDEEILKADDPRPQRVTQYPVKRSPRKSGEEAIPTSVFDTEKHDEEMRASYGTDNELGYKPVFLYVERGPGQGQLVQVRQGQLVIGRRRSPSCACSTRRSRGATRWSRASPNSST